MIRALFLIFLICATSSVSAAEWYLNGRSAQNPYQIWAMGDDGLPSAVTPAVPISGNVANIAWPSTVQEGSVTRIYASTYVSGKWSDVHLYTSTDGLNFSDQGIVFSANANEPYGIGPSHIMRDPDGPDPYVMYYLVRGPSGPGSSIGVATSDDGITWTRRGIVVSSSLPEEAGGLSLSYACRDSMGDIVLVYHGYDAGLDKGVPIVATAPTPTSAFSNKTIIKTGDNFSTAFTGTAGQNTGVVSIGVTVPIGIPLLAYGTDREPIVVLKQEGSRVWLTRPLLYSYSNASLYSMARYKVEISYIHEMPDGSWRGIATLYGPATGIVAEYTTSLSSPTLTVPWNYVGDGLRFTPWLSGTSYSLENPEPARRNASCSN